MTDNHSSSPYSSNNTLPRKACAVRELECERTRSRDHSATARRQFRIGRSSPPCCSGRSVCETQTIEANSKYFEGQSPQSATATARQVSITTSSDTACERAQRNSPYVWD